jgi:hypothetical protein
VNRAVSAPWASPAESEGRRWLLLGLLLLVGAVTAGAAVATNGNILATVAPVMTVALIWAICVAPIRLPLLALAFLSLALDAPYDGPWNSPVAPLGRLLGQNLDKTIPIDALTLPLMAVMLIFLLLIHIHRRLSGSRVDAVDRVEAAGPLVWSLGFSFLTVIALVALGIRGGGNVQMAKIQVQNFVWILLTAYLFAVSMRGMRDYRILGRLILAAAFSKSLMALWAHFTINPTPPYATIHGDSMLFTGATIMLLARFAEQPVRRNALLCVGSLPLLLGAMLANNRRLAWVELAASVLTLYIVSRRTPLKRFVTRAVLLAAPVILLYVTVGWNSNSEVFAPVKVLRSVGDASVDGSTLFRDLENYNLLLTLRHHPIMGSGFGLQFDASVVMPDISFFKEYRYMPHNSVLGLWGFTGVLGFTGLFLAAVVGVYLAARSYSYAQAPAERAAAFTALAMVLIYLIQCWGDIGFSERVSIFLVGPALAAAGQLAVSTGAWGDRPATAAVRGKR